MNTTTIKNVTFAKDAQKMMGDALMANAKVINGVKYLEIPLQMLTIQTLYQRHNKGHEKAIAAQWDKRKAGVITVSYRDGVFYIIDGQHRFLAANIVGEESMTCQVYENLTIEQEAEIFGSQMENVVKLNTSETFRAMLVAKHEKETEIANICKKYNLVIMPNENGEKPVLKALKAAENSYRIYGRKCLEFTFDIIKQSGWHNERNAYSEVMVISLRNVFANHQNDLKSAKIILIRFLEHINFDLLKAKACCTYIGRGNSGAVTSLFEKLISTNGNLELIGAI